MAAKIQFRRDTSANWTSNNTLLSQGEIGLDLTNGTFKIGDGVTAWNSLAYTATLPTQTSNSGKYLTTNGTTASWNDISTLVLPTLTGNSGKYLTTNGTTSSWTTSLTPVSLFETKVAMAANAIDLSLGNYFTKTISGATTFTVSNTPASGTVGEFILDLTNGGSATITWWGVKWVSGTAPTLTTSGRDSLGFFTHDGGTTWTGVVIGKDIK